MNQILIRRLLYGAYTVHKFNKSEILLNSTFIKMQVIRKKTQLKNSPVNLPKSVIFILI